MNQWSYSRLDIHAILSTHGLITLAKFRKDIARYVDLSMIKYFGVSLIFFSTVFTLPLFQPSYLKEECSSWKIDVKWIKLGVASPIFEPNAPNFQNQYIYLICLSNITIIFWYLKRCDFQDWPNHCIKFFGHNFCLVPKSKVHTKMY